MPLDVEALGLDPALGLPDQMWVATVRADWSPTARAKLRNAYRQDLSHQRLRLVGGLIGFLLTGLAILTGYIRLDEATKGYYTNRLRLAALATTGAAGWVIAQFLS